MWWIFEKREDTHERVVYRYSRESGELDGLIEKDRVTGKVNMIRPCSSDNELVWCQYKAVREFASCVMEEGFPQTRKVVIGW